MIKFLLIFWMAIAQGYEVSICAIFKNEAPYLKEWIEFHKIQGVEHFYLYNNDSSDHYLEILQPYINSRCVSLVDWPYTYEFGETNAWLDLQRAAYVHCLKGCKSEPSWVAFIDLDEFLFCPNGMSLKEFLRPYQRYGGVCVNWLMFGTSEIEEIPPGQTMIENLIHCAPLEEARHLRGKSIVQPKYVNGCLDAHTFSFKRGLFTVNVGEKKITGGMELSQIFHDRIRINHYWTRTESWFRTKKIPSRNRRRDWETPDVLHQRSTLYNERTDTAILRFVPLLRKNLGLDP